MEEDLKTGAAAFLGVGSMRKRTVEKLSGGMKKRLSIACALSNHAGTLILDEPGAALDMECKADIRAYLRRYQKEGGTVILTSHERTELELCTELYVLRDGKLEKGKTGMSEEEMIQWFR